MSTICADSQNSTTPPAAASTGATATAALRELPFVQYYLRQGVFHADELESTIATLQAPLPVCFRVNPTSSSAELIKSRLTNDFPALFASIVHDNKPLLPPVELPWYPFAQSAWQLDCGRNDFSKLGRAYPAVQAFRDFVLYHTAEGNISRQEAVSMIPALLLDVQRTHRVLDLCAAPGSKTKQVMEELVLKASAATQRDEASSSNNTSGFIVANDANEKRGHLLVHQLQRLGLDNAVVTCHLGQDFPGLYATDKTEKVLLQTTDVFDRVLCDVPCSGDGTIRKNKNLWRQWAVGGALTLYKLQLAIALRAAALLKPDGLMVYSTCSLNPIENEAVVAELLRRADGALEVVDASHLLPGLKRRPGLQTWDVAYQSRDVKRSHVEWFDTYEDVPDTLRGERIPHSMFPPSSSSSSSSVATAASLQHCMRLFPSDQNTGGFFVTLLRKTRALPGGAQQSGLLSFEDAARSAKRAHKQARNAAAAAATGDTPQPPPTRRWPISAKAQRRIDAAAKLRAQEQDANSAAEDAPDALHQYAKLRAAHWDHIRAFYGLRDGFSHEHLFARSDGAISVCLVNPSVQAACLQGGRDLKILNTGVRVFARVQAGDQLIFRPTEDGLVRVLPFVTKRLINDASAADVELLLSPSTSSTGQVAHALERFSSAFHAAVAQLRAESSNGPAIVVPAVTTTTTMTTTATIHALPIWIGDKSVVLLADKLVQKRLAHAFASASESQEEDGSATTQATTQ